MNRLRTLDAALADEVAEITDDTRRRTLARSVAVAVAERLEIASQPAIAAVLAPTVDAASDEQRGALTELVEEWDEAAWQQQDAGNEDGYVTLFCRARAANAVLEYALPPSDDTLADVLYEAHAATEDLDFVRSLVS